MQGHRSAGDDGSHSGPETVAQTHLNDDADDRDAAPEGPSDAAPDGRSDTAPDGPSDEAPDAPSDAVPGEASTDDDPERGDADPTADAFDDATDDPRVDAILQGVGDLAAEIAVLRQQTADVLRVQRRHTAHIDELHAENQRLRKGEVQTALAPMIRDVIRLHDEVTRLAAVSAPEAADDMAIVDTRILDLLDRWGITAHTPPVGTPFDPARHQGVSRVEGVPADDGTIATVRRPGFRDADGRVIRPADVAVVRAAPSSPAPPDSADLATTAADLPTTAADPLTASPADPSTTGADDEPQTIAQPADPGPTAVE